MPSLTPFGIGTKLYRERLNHPDLNPLEVALMRLWEEINTRGNTSPVIAIAADIFRLDQPEQPLLPQRYWQGHVDPQLLAMISSAVQWSGTNVGRSDFEAMVRKGVRKRRAVRRYMEHNNSHRIINQVIHVCNERCGTKQYDLLFGWHWGCNFVPVTKRYENIFYVTVAWLLTGEGQSLHAAAVAIERAGELERRERSKERAHQLLEESRNGTSS